MPPANLSENESAIWQALGTDELHIDEVIQSTGQPASEVSVTLMRMELRRQVKQLPGRRYVRLI